MIIIMLGTVGTVGDGNTKSPTSRDKKQKWWFFTFNNYEDQLGSVAQWFEQVDAKYVIGEEVGESGTPHLQGMVGFKCAKRLSNIRKDEESNLGYNKIHWEPLRNWKAAYEYCQKDGVVCKNIVPKSKKPTWQEQMRINVMQSYDGVEWRDWQRDCIRIVESELESRDDRVIHWFHESSGNVGKTFLAKYLVAKFEAIIVSGKGTDVLNQVKCRCEAEKEVNVVVCNITRSVEEYVSYSVLEQLKDGLMYSGKYEGGQILLDKAPVIICFANCEPNYEKMSADRWHVVNLGEEEEAVFGSPEPSA